MIVGHDPALAAFRGAWDSRRLHHGWLLAGRRGVGKAKFACDAARRLLADAAGPASDLPGLEVPPDHPISHLIAAGSHPDFRWLERLERPSGGLARNISVAQVRSLGEMLAMTPSLSGWRGIVIDAVDDLEAEAANALLKMLEEPPANTVFLLVSHVPGRLLPTIGSRCRRLDFKGLDDDVMMALLGQMRSDLSPDDRQGLVALADGSIGRALDIAALDLAPLERMAIEMMRSGDPLNERRSALAKALAGKAAAERYAAFLAIVPSLIAREARAADGRRRTRALDAYARARDSAAIAPRLTLDPAATSFELGSILASVAG